MRTAGRGPGARRRRDREATAHLGGRLASGLVDVTRDPTALDGDGWWAVVATFEGDVVCARFADNRPAPPPGGRWRGPADGAWATSLDRAAYLAAVADVRARIAAGDVYQVNVCRVLSARLPDPDAGEVSGLAMLLARGNPAPFGGHVDLPSHGVALACASPELFLRRRGSTVESSPIKGTGRVAADLQAKDEAENVMIVDLVRNDLSIVARTGSVTVPSLLHVEEHPGLVHLVSTVRAELADGVGWGDLLGAAFPPGSVSGAPKGSALHVIAEVEPVPRGPYCGAVGWVDADQRRGELAVGIRTFWCTDDHVHFGTGAGITWGSEAEREWDETELKAARLLRVAAGTCQAPERELT